MEMAELQKRKRPLNLAIVFADPEGFIENLMGWLEITSHVTALRLGEVAAPADGGIPLLSTAQLYGGAVANVGNDAMFAFCMTAALTGDKGAVDRVETALTERMGSEFPGSFALWHFRAKLDAPVSLDDFVGQSGAKLLAGDISPPPLRPKENWSTGLRFLEKARKSNFVHEIMYPLAKWHRDRWGETLEKGVAFLQHIEDTVPVLQDVLKETRNDEPFIAELLHKMAPAVDMELGEDTAGYLRSLARRS